MRGALELFEGLAAVQVRGSEPGLLAVLPTAHLFALAARSEYERERRFREATRAAAERAAEPHPCCRAL